MPIYEYRCRKCGVVFERFLKTQERGDELACPLCGEKKPEKVFSSFFSKGSDTSCGSGGGSSYS